METENPNAFSSTDLQTVHFNGVTLRDYFANSAMQGLISNTEWMKVYKNEKYLMQLNIASEVAYKYADAMLKQREL